MSETTSENDSTEKTKTFDIQEQNLPEYVLHFQKSVCLTALIFFNPQESNSSIIAVSTLMTYSIIEYKHHQGCQFT